ncbi:SGNH/GDSL hydrolase family protein [Chitinophagaceae bacterium LB-8]|jgi:lysophospholipase L1-like esterase|uniref:SGNH/GDSL hydrolase family protein n=1 Tax=Paraflavisolibacter caeni TaxID=2982496 RepID=A0A9X2Y1G5_9BACT|nr:SGNH/GDSL hydrolase family protein [Paraflavisolibacter caeni]MCU7552867.1 SGNH/GDSL hydrolase family protein [Paraflavisolibacter caeni]
MQRFCLIATIFLGIQIQCYTQPYAIPGNVKRIVFIGNSITYAGYYTSCIDAYLRLQYPEKHVEIINLGLPSETVSGLSESNHAGGKFPRPDLHERLDRILKIKPDLVFACYGMNDGIYQPFDNDRFQKFCEGMSWMHEQVTQSGASIIHITSPIYDERKGKAYANVLDIYSDWLISRRYTNNWNVIDIFSVQGNRAFEFSWSANNLQVNIFLLTISFFGHDSQGYSKQQR